MLPAALAVFWLGGFKVNLKCLGCCGGANKVEEIKQINPETYSKFKLIKKEQVTHNTWLYRFGLPDPERSLGLKPGTHVQIRAIVDKEECVKPYTPVSLADTKGHFDLLIKTYPEGRISKYITSVEIGEEVEMRGPKGKFEFAPNIAKQIGMIAGGTGITPLLSVARAIFEDPQDETRVTLLFANRSPEDVLLESELRDLERKHPDRFKVYLTVDEPDEKWDGLVGRVSLDMIKECLPGPSEDTKIFHCGPPKMNEMVRGLLGEAGYNLENGQVFKF